MKFSLIATTYRGIEALRPLFTVSDSDAELIIIDSKFCNETREKLKELSHQYAQVVYAPPKVCERPHRFDMMSALNTGYALSEGDWWVRIDDFMEFKPDYFDRAREAVQECKTVGRGVFIRAVELEESNHDVRWNSFVPEQSERYIKLPCKPLGKPIPIMTLGTALCKKEAILDINGIDERYDDGYGWNDNDMFIRAILGGYYVFLDTKQLIYRHAHESTGVGEGRYTNQRFFFDVAQVELQRGEYKTKNGFNLSELNKRMLEYKPGYVL